MNKNGFTFIELLAIIALIGIITLIAIPSIRLADKKTTQKTYDTKVKFIKAAAEDYAEDYREIIINQENPTYYTESGNNYPSKNITVRDLLNHGYISKDPEIKNEDILDPRDKTSMLSKSITVYIKNNRGYAKLNF